METSRWQKLMVEKRFNTKYLGKNRLKCLDKPLTQRKGMMIWKLCQQYLSVINSQLYWIPGNGKKFFIWEDTILFNQPLKEEPGLEGIKEALENIGIKRLEDISEWEGNPKKKWKGCQKDLHLLEE